MATDLTERLSDCLASLRAARGWTLDRLASESGVSRAALSRLENAEVSPSADVLSRLAGAYGVTPSRLLGMVEEGFVAHIRRDDQAVTRAATTGASQRRVSPAARALAAEVLECRLSPGAHLEQALPPVPGQEHHLVMISGYMAAEVDGRGYDLEPGDALRFRPYGALRFATRPGQGAKYVLCLISGSG
ncbi:helix-turn-helix domain-containing protein [Pacificoceanicola onchidii]|uniref:helix-turn-helix domain-containing protein n=1 Tax=Pacificoceanicola onchidii TaxID=2562685 RepID=UPI0010A53EC0|nr:XRE family transcriptional regulator [Pacificoceanicola onchidii]